MDWLNSKKLKIFVDMKWKMKNSIQIVYVTLGQSQCLFYITPMI